MSDDIKLPELPEPEGWVFQHEDTGRMTTLANDGINNPENFRANNPRFELCETIYAEKKMQADARAAVELNRAWLPIESAPKNKRLIVYDGECGVDVATNEYGAWSAGYNEYGNDITLNAVTHWMPLPDEPEPSP